MPYMWQEKGIPEVNPFLFFLQVNPFLASIFDAKNNVYGIYTQFLCRGIFLFLSTTFSSYSLHIVIVLFLIVAHLTLFLKLF